MHSLIRIRSVVVGLLLCGRAVADGQCVTAEVTVGH